MTTFLTKLYKGPDYVSIDAITVSYMTQPVGFSFFFCKILNIIDLEYWPLKSIFLNGHKNEVYSMELKHTHTKQNPPTHPTNQRNKTILTDLSTTKRKRKKTIAESIGRHMSLNSLCLYLI